MFEAAEIGHTLSKRTYEREVPKLRQALLAAQYELLERKRFPVVVLVSGVDGAGKGETVNLLNEWMDPRHIQTIAFGEASDEESRTPEMARFWRALPPKGKVGILFGSWYTDPIVRRVLGEERRSSFERRLERIRHFERMLVAEGALVIKLWFHLGKEAQRARLKKLASSKKTSWRVTREDFRRFAHYDEFRSVSERALRETSTGEAPWHIIEGANPEYRSLTAGRLLLDGIRKRLDGPPPVLAPPAPPPVPSIDRRDVLNTLDYSRTISPQAYDTQLEKLQGRLNRLTREKKMRERSIVIAFEGMDAAGKGSTIRRITRSLDARHYNVVPVAAPTEEERAQPYLWRFWRHIPPHGRTLIFDRSWYGRVLVERVEKFCVEADWMRGYHEINEFEEQLAEGGVILAKFWMAITLEEQLKRFRARQKTPHKQFKITAEDWRNRKKWPLYERAVSDMVQRTSTDVAPWFVIAANDKKWARIEVLRSLCERIESCL